jgi:hypothetical protein
MADYKLQQQMCQTALDDNSRYQRQAEDAGDFAAQRDQDIEDLRAELRELRRGML